MLPEQIITQAIMQIVIEAAKAVKMAVRETKMPVNTMRPVPAVPKAGVPLLRQPMFDWKSTYK